MLHRHVGVLGIFQSIVNTIDKIFFPGERLKLISLTNYFSSFSFVWVVRTIAKEAHMIK